MISKAYGKINLALEVKGRRSDQYHEIASVIQTINLFDKIEVLPNETIDLKCDVPELSNSGNLAMVAAKVLQRASGEHQGVMVDLEKNIPIAAGLGGGSADAATMLRLLNNFWDLSYPLSTLNRLAMGIGSDVPFFLLGGTGLVTGRGENVAPLPSMAPVWVLLVVPNIKLVAKTKSLYDSLTDVNFSAGDSVEAVAVAIRAGAEIPVERMINTFEPVFYEYLPGLKDYRDAVLRSGANSTHLSGTGPSLFTLFKEEEEGRRILDNLIELRIEAYLVRTVTPDP